MINSLRRPHRKVRLLREPQRQPKRLRPRPTHSETSTTMQPTAMGGFASFIYNQTPKDQFRLVTQLRNDFFQIPYDPEPNSFENQQLQLQRAARHPARNRRPGRFSWIHTFNPSTVLQVSPFYHYNLANYKLVPTTPP